MSFPPSAVAAVAADTQTAATVDGCRGRRTGPARIERGLVGMTAAASDAARSIGTEWPPMARASADDCSEDGDRGRAPWTDSASGRHSAAAHDGEPSQQKEGSFYMKLRQKTGRMRSNSDEMPLMLSRPVLQEKSRPLKKWLMRHRDTPYPTGRDKRLLAERCNMTVTQVSNWFANARRRLKRTVGDPQMSWAGRIRLYDSCLVGKQEPLDVSSDDESVEDDDDDEDEDEDGDDDVRIRVASGGSRLPPNRTSLSSAADIDPAASDCASPGSSDSGVHLTSTSPVARLPPFALSEFSVNDDGDDGGGIDDDDRAGIDRNFSDGNDDDNNNNSNNTADSSWPLRRLAFSVSATSTPPQHRSWPSVDARSCSSRGVDAAPPTSGTPRKGAVVDVPLPSDGAVDVHRRMKLWKSEDAKIWEASSRRHPQTLDAVVDAMAPFRLKPVPVPLAAGCFRGSVSAAPAVRAFEADVPVNGLGRYADEPEDLSVRGCSRRSADDTDATRVAEERSAASSTSRGHGNNQQVLRQYLPHRHEEVKEGNYDVVLKCWEKGSESSTDELYWKEIGAALALTTMATSGLKPQRRRL